MLLNMLSTPENLLQECKKTSTKELAFTTPSLCLDDMNSAINDLKALAMCWSKPVQQIELWQSRSMCEQTFFGRWRLIEIRAVLNLRHNGVQFFIGSSDHSLILRIQHMLQMLRRLIHTSSKSKEIEHGCCITNTLLLTMLTGFRLQTSFTCFLFRG